MDTLPFDADTNSHGFNHVQRTFINPSLWFDDCDGFRVFFCRHEILYRVALHDHAHLKIIAVTLRQSRLATQPEIAKAFGHTVGTQRRWEKLYAQLGSAAFTPKPHTGRPPSVDAAQHAFVRRWFLDNLPTAESLDVSRSMKLPCDVSSAAWDCHLPLSAARVAFPPPSKTPHPASTPTPVPAGPDIPLPPQDVPLPQSAESDPQTFLPTVPSENQPSANQQTTATVPVLLGFTIDNNPLDRSGRANAAGKHGNFHLPNYSFISKN